MNCHCSRNRSKYTPVSLPYRWCMSSKALSPSTSIHQHSRHAFSLRACLVVKDFVRLEHEIGGFDIVAVGIMIRNGLPRVGEIEIHNARLNGYFVPHNSKQFLQPVSQGLVGPNLVKLRE